MGFIYFGTPCISVTHVTCEVSWPDQRLPVQDPIRINCVLETYCFDTTAILPPKNAFILRQIRDKNRATINRRRKLPRLHASNQLQSFAKVLFGTLQVKIANELQSFMVRPP